MTTPGTPLANLPQFTDLCGQPLENGRIYIGVTNTDPRSNPIPIFYDGACTIPAPQPLGTINGYVSRGGSPAKIFVQGSPYSLMVLDQQQKQVYYDPAAGSDLTAAGAGGLPISVATALQDLATTDWYASPHAAGIANLNQRLFVAPSATITLNVPADVATIPLALAAIQDWIIMGTVQIQVADGTYTLPPITLAHPFGENIHIIGNTAAPANCALQFNGTNGIAVATGTVWGEINGFYIQQTGTKGATFGVSSFGGQLNKFGPNAVIDGFYYPLAALNGATIYADGTDSTVNRIEVKNGGDVGVWAISHSFISCVYAYSHSNSDNSTPGNPLGGGFVCEFSSAIVANNATATNNNFCGFAAQTSSSMRAWTCTSTNNLHGIRPGSQGSIEVFGGSTISNNTGFGVFSDGDGQCYGANTATMTGNALGNLSDPFYVDSTSAVHVDSGTLTLNAGPSNITANTTYFDQNTAASNFSVMRWLTAEVEQWRMQYRRDQNLFTWGGSSITSLYYTPLTGDIGVGVGAPVTTANSGFLQIPRMAGAPIGAPTLLTGYAPIVFDSTNGKLWVYNGSAWHGVVLT